MTAMSSDKARDDLSGLIKQVSRSHEPIQIVDNETSAVLIAEEDWRAINETLYLLSIPGMREKIREGLNTPLEECSEDPEW